MLRKDLRLKNASDFSFLSKKGYFAKERNISVRWICEINLKKPLVGIVISRKFVKKAITRSLIKRRLRTILYEYYNELPSNFKGFFQVTTATVKKSGIPYSLLKEDIHNLILYINKKDE